MSRFNAGPLAGLFTAVIFITACSSSDNLSDGDGGIDHPVFPAISNDLANAKYEKAAAFADDLPYQAALIYEVVLKGRDYDKITRPVTLPQGSSDCALGGFTAHSKSPQLVDISFGKGTLDVSSVSAYGCTVEEADNETQRMSLGGFATTAGEVVCAADDEEMCEIAYTQYNGYYGVQYLKPVGAGVDDWKRMEIYGSRTSYAAAYTMDGPRLVELEDAGGTVEEAQEQRQRMVMFSSTAQRSATGSATDEKVFALQYGASETPFVLQKFSGDRLRLDGVLSSGVNRTECPGGRFNIDPVDDHLLQLVDGKITSGKLALRSGSGSSRKDATLTFLAGGGVEIASGEGAPQEVSWAVIDDLRAECFQTVPLKG